MPKVSAARKLAEAKASEFIGLMAQSNAAKSKAEKIAKELAVAHGRGDFDNFDFEHNGKTYDVGLLVESGYEVDVERLACEVSRPDLLQLVGCSQKTVKDFGGDTLLNSVLVLVEKPAAFKIKARR